MSEAYLGEIRMFTGFYAPTGWAFCDGSLLPTNMNQDLFALIGTTYGGSATLFALPDLRGRVPMHSGSGPGLTPRTIGQSGGQETVFLDEVNMPVHSHPIFGVETPATDRTPQSLSAPAESQGRIYSTPGGANLAIMSANAISKTGGNVRHENMQPFVAVSFIISIAGAVPPRS